MGLEDPVQVLDLEDRVGQDLSRTVVNVLRHALALAFLRLDDAQAQGGRGVVGHRSGLVDGLVGRPQVAPQQIELADDEVEPLQPGLEPGQLAAALLVLGAERIGPDRSECVTSAVEPLAELHPLLEVVAIVVAELLGQLVQPARVTAEALRGQFADAVEAGAGRSGRRIVRHDSP